MKEFFEKYKKIIIIVLIILLLLLIGLGIYFFVLKDNGTEESTTSDQSTEATEDTVTPMPEYDERSSSEAIEATYAEAKVWSSDAKLYDCSGLTLSSVVYPDITYTFLGVDGGKYRDWNCTYYSSSKGQTLMYIYDQGDIDGNTDDAFDTGEYGYLQYGDIQYPADPTSIVDSNDVYATAVENGLDGDTNYYNMYLGDTMDYGYVWRVEEKSRTEVDEDDIAVVLYTYIIDTNGALIGKVEDSIY